MATYNTQYDSANTAVRALLTWLGQYYSGSPFNTNVKAGKEICKAIKKEFKYKCAYCGIETDKVQMDHLIMMNRNDYGLHYPGNFVPSSQKCNKRSKKVSNSKEYNSWEDHLHFICTNNKQENLFHVRWKQKSPSL